MCIFVDIFKTRKVRLELLKYHDILLYSLLFLTRGHSIEAGWFLLQYATKKNLTDLKRTAIEKFIVNPFQYGWDDQYGGLYYYLDVDGHSPVQVTAILFCFVKMYFISGRYEPWHVISNNVSF